MHVIVDIVEFMSSNLITIGRTIQEWVLKGYVLRDGHPYRQEDGVYKVIMMSIPKE